MTPPHSFEGVHCAMTQEQPLQIGEGSTVPQQKCLKPFYQEQSWERAIIPCASGAGNASITASTRKAAGKRKTSDLAST